MLQAPVNNDLDVPAQPTTSATVNFPSLPLNNNEEEDIDDDDDKPNTMGAPGSRADGGGGGSAGQTSHECSSCGQVLLPSTKFCSECGTKTGGAPLLLVQ